MSERPYTFDSVVRIIITLSILTLIVFFVLRTRDALLPFFIGWLIAYLINPIVLFVKKTLHIKNKIPAIILTIIFLCGLVTGVLFLVLPSIIDQTHKLIELITKVINSNSNTNSEIISFIKEHILVHIKESQILQELSGSDASAIIQKVFKIIGDILIGSFDLLIGIFTLFAILLYVIFILKDYETITEGASNLVPPKYRSIFSVVANDTINGMNRYFRGQATVALIVGILLAIGFAIYGLPMGIVLGLFIGVLNLVPYLQLVGIVPMIISVLLKCSETGDSFWISMSIAIGILSLVQVFQDTFLVPKIMGKATGLNPAIILLSLSVWGSLLGIIGMIIALPMTNVLLSFYNRFVINGNHIDNEISNDERL